MQNGAMAQTCNVQMPAKFNLPLTNQSLLLPANVFVSNETCNTMHSNGTEPIPQAAAILQRRTIGMHCIYCELCECGRYPAAQPMAMVQ